MASLLREEGMERWHRRGLISRACAIAAQQQPARHVATEARVRVVPVVVTTGVRGDPKRLRQFWQEALSSQIWVRCPSCRGCRCRVQGCRSFGRRGRRHRLDSRDRSSGSERERPLVVVGKQPVKQGQRDEGHEDEGGPDSRARCGRAPGLVNRTGGRMGRAWLRCPRPIRARLLHRREV
jgi:hypothetical protein